MPVRIRMILHGPEIGPSALYADPLRAVVFRAISAAHPALGQLIHDTNGPKPLAIGPLRPAAERNASCAVEIAFLTDPPLEAFLEGIGAPGSTVRLRADAYALAGLETAASASYDDLAAAATLQPTLSLEMRTPTAHHAVGPVRRSVLLPDPALYIGSWLGRWNRFADRPFEDSLLKTVEEYIVISAFQGRTVRVQLQRPRVFIGFVGRVTFTVLSEAPQPRAVSAAIHTLARFAEYAGTGVETMRSMGQTRIVPFEPSKADRRRPDGRETDEGNDPLYR